ncbi:MAG: DUF962 domain-containing protein [Betaproteobacteria bacterium]|nr:DUF962 domain-containing protein [Betaproteobacteria bacterium]
MRTLEEQITQYAAYHRDRRNIATHFVGVPMIVFAVAMGLALVPLPFLPGQMTLAFVVTLVAVAYYFRLDYALGVAMLIYMTFNLWLAIMVAGQFTTGMAAGVALGIFVVGWIIQFIGHKFEGMKPAFFDDVMGLAIGPLFVMTEVFFLLKWKPDLQRYVEARVGPTLAARNGATIGPASGG